MNRWVSVKLIALSFCSISCVEEIQLGNPAEFNPELVVEGSINDFDHSFQVQLKTTSSIRGIGENLLGIGAQVRIFSAQDTIDLSESKPGIYETDSGALIVRNGRSYGLDIRLQDQRHYQSTLVSLPESIPLISAFAEPLNTSRVDELGVFRRSWAQKVFVAFENSNSPQYFKVDMTGWREKYVSYITLVLAPISCWAFENPAIREITIGNNENVVGDSYLVTAGGIGVTGKERYIAEIKVSALSEEAYRYWLAAKTQLDRDKGVFVAPFATVNGNISNINDDSETVHGYFHAYSQQLIRTCFNSFDLPLRNPIALLTMPCAEFFAPAEYELPFEDELCE